MDDEQVWLEEAEYQDAPVHRLRKAPIAAAVAAAATIALVMAMPRSWVERAVFELYVDTVIPAAKLPIGDMGHAVVALVAAALVAIVAFAIARLVDFGRLLSRRKRTPELGHDGEVAEPRLRRADSHPDAPPRAPFRFDADYDEDNRDHEDYGAESSYDPAAMTDDDADDWADDRADHDADDEMFDLGGFEAGDEGDEDAGERGVFDVAAIDPLDARPKFAAAVEEDDTPPLVAPDEEIDPLVDVRAKFADMFEPGDRDDDTRDGSRRDLSRLSTSELIDELERRMAARQGVATPAQRPPAEMDAAPIEAQAEAQAEAPIEAPVEQAINGTDGDDMDAALQAALGTLARMQQRSAG
ncbi:hypothetical protein FSZ31_11005 [Sphingorhabdus soli]|uniref:Uncharacterized protein n=1 Tax=Flavisphingopyxis soli TaxID=2601267 RepID=A0A5C6U5L8_9SPHN|nr:hypothetical protein [Sphingorhabdus soli]TXC68213.1 hypothetical protein FSZ31_11005 [Sphingorhabdus soli]